MKKNLVHKDSKQKTEAERKKALMKNCFIHMHICIPTRQSSSRNLSSTRISQDGLACPNIQTYENLSRHPHITQTNRTHEHRAYRMIISIDLATPLPF